MSFDKKTERSCIETAWDESTQFTDIDIAVLQCALDVREKRTHPGLTRVTVEDFELAVDAVHAAANANHPRGRAMIDQSAELAVRCAGEDAWAFAEPMQVSDRQLQLYVQGLDIKDQRTASVPVRDALMECDQAILSIEMTLEAVGRPDLIV